MKFVVLAAVSFLISTSGAAAIAKGLAQGSPRTPSINPIGTYHTTYDKLRVQQSKRGSYWIDINAMRGPPSYNLGYAGGSAKIVDGVAVLSKQNCPDCMFLMKFNGPKVMVIQRGTEFQCEFGNAVSATGIYTRGKARSRTPDQVAHSPVRFVDTRGRIAIPGSFENALPFSAGLSAVKKSKKWGFIDRKGKLVVPYQYDSAGSFSQGLAAVSTKDKTGYIDKHNKFVLQPVYANGNCFSPEGIAAVTLANGKWSYINKKGERLSNKDYDQCNDFKDGRGIVTLNSLCGAVDETGKEVIPIRYNSLGHFCDGLASFSESSDYSAKKGYLDRDGKIAISLRFDLVSDFSEGLAAVSIDNHWGYIDKSGRYALQPQFLEAGDFVNGQAIVRFRKDPHFRIIDKSGKKIAQLPFECIATTGEIADGSAFIEILDWSGVFKVVPIDLTGKPYPAFLLENAPIVTGDPKADGLFITGQPDW